MLLAAVIPTFLGARNNANARAAEANLRNGLSAEAAFYTYNQSFSGSVADLTTVEPGLGWTTVAPTTKGGKTVSATVFQSTGTSDSNTPPDSGDNAVILQAYGQDGICYGIMQVSLGSNLGATSKVGTFYNARSGPCQTVGPLTGLATSASGKAAQNLGTTWYPSF